MQELEEEEDALNREFGSVCADIAAQQDKTEDLAHELTSLTALMETASGNVVIIILLKFSIKFYNMGRNT